MYGGGMIQTTLQIQEVEMTTCIYLVEASGSALCVTEPPDFEIQPFGQGGARVMLKRPGHQPVGVWEGGESKARGVVKRLIRAIRDAGYGEEIALADLGEDEPGQD